MAAAVVGRQLELAAIDGFLDAAHHDGNQFGSGQLGLSRANQLCLPSQKEHVT
jgi:hypothetical protein